jgi:uncharacterized membrane protein
LSIKIHRVFKRLRKKRFGYRLIGWWLFFCGFILLYSSVSLLLDPESEILLNGVPTKSMEVKRNAVLFTIIFPIIGGLLAFIPKRRLNKLLIWQARINPFIASKSK